MAMGVDNLVHDVWHVAAIGFGLFLSLLATGHVVLNKRDSRAAIAWVGFVWFVPLIGAVMYFLCCEGTLSATGHKPHSPNVCRRSCTAICRITEGISRCWLGSLEVW